MFYGNFLSKNSKALYLVPSFTAIRVIFHTMAGIVFITLLMQQQGQQSLCIATWTNEDDSMQANMAYIITRVAARDVQQTLPRFTFSLSKHDSDNEPGSCDVQQRLLIPSETQGSELNVLARADGRIRSSD